MEVFPKKILSVIHPSKFNFDKSINYHLSIHIGHGLIKVCCIERTTQECLLLGVYALPLDKNHPSYIRSLEQFYNQDFFLIKKNWSSVTLSISNQKFTLLPHLLLSTKDLFAYMHVACGVDPNDEVISFTHALAKVSVVFSENAAVLDWFRKRYTGSNFHIIHQANAIIEGYQIECLPKPKLFVWLAEDYFYIIVHNKRKLLYCNLFTYNTSDDFLSYLSAVIQVMHLERTSCALLVGGLIEKRSLAYRQLKAYIPRTTLKTKINFLNANAYVFKKSGTLPMLYFDLISSFLCHTHSKAWK
ncbi:DUF3822 family protein [Cardinium endosymbiont of Oedothorax gibbosus]|uniref:DUF3822 family protein n=1 Tax=Cardinium endosymbiont of Oedothorax gibbosus TaxID=931101 RepID=UPI0020240BE9|nr:DUF3822 family protein [Cardinium endosymbiont of Oedothorax gibbosus]CAH2559930.1 Protein of unknown function DUF3822 [Cardinium endosymbiont of Oedothorax gibbosus]